MLVNTARGGVVDEEALLAELEAGRIYAGLDVYATEPAPSERLRRAPFSHRMSEAQLGMPGLR